MQEQLALAGRARDLAQVGLLTMRATTTAGIAALLRYTYEYDRGDEWVDLVLDSDGNLSTRHLFSEAGGFAEDEESAPSFELEVCRVVAETLNAGGVS